MARKKYRWNYFRVLVFLCAKFELEMYGQGKAAKCDRMPLFVLECPNRIRAADFINDTLYAGKQFNNLWNL
jgi:hypothetical protein